MSVRCCAGQNKVAAGTPGVTSAVNGAINGVCGAGLLFCPGINQCYSQGQYNCVNSRSSLPMSLHRMCSTSWLSSGPLMLVMMTPDLRTFLACGKVSEVCRKYKYAKHAFALIELGPAGSLSPQLMSNCKWVLPSAWWGVPNNFRGASRLRQP